MYSNKKMRFQSFARLRGGHAAPRPGRWLAIGLIALIGLLLLALYAPLLLWLARSSLTIGQLQTGGVLVVLALVLCLRDLIGRERMEPSLTSEGLGLLVVGLACPSLARWLPKLALPLVLFSFCLSVAAVLSFLFGRVGVRRFLPALGGFLVFGLLVGMFPSLDWPLRGLAARYSAGVLSGLNVPVHLLAVPSRPPELVLEVAGRMYRVATECNGFGILTSALLLAVILGLQNRLSLFRKLGLLALAAVVALGSNLLRIVVICLVVPRVRLPYLIIHEGVGLVFYLIALAIVWYAAEEFADKGREGGHLQQAEGGRTGTTGPPRLPS